MHTGLIEMRGTTSPRLLLELVSARMLLPAASTDGAALLQRLERMERRLSVSSAPVGEEVGAPPERPADPPRRSERPAGGSGRATGAATASGTGAGGVGTAEESPRPVA